MDETNTLWDDLAAYWNLDSEASQRGQYPLTNEGGVTFPAGQVGNIRLHTILTPGHTPGSMCFLVEGSPVLFSGDTLFPGGPGATKFEGSSFPTIIESIDRRLLTLPVETLVLPGHGDDTTIGTERPHLQEWIDRGW